MSKLYYKLGLIKQAQEFVLKKLEIIDKILNNYSEIQYT